METVVLCVCLFLLQSCCCLAVIRLDELKRGNFNQEKGNYQIERKGLCKAVLGYVAFFSTEWCRILGQPFFQRLSNFRSFGSMMFALMMRLFLSIYCQSIIFAPEIMSDVKLPNKCKNVSTYN